MDAGSWFVWLLVFGAHQASNVSFLRRTKRGIGRGVSIVLAWRRSVLCCKLEALSDLLALFVLELWERRYISMVGYFFTTVALCERFALHKIPQRGC